jgi:pimeloyl-ACP methyl ester carboxylesterase
MRLDDEATALEPLLLAAGGTHLVGHSYGGAVAIKLALMFPERVASVTVYEPVLFRLLLDYRARDRAATELLLASESMRRALQLGHAGRAARRFVDFWSGEGTWDGLAEVHRQSIASRMPVVIGHFNALFNDSIDRAALSQLEVPVLCMTGERTRPVTRRLGELIRLALPDATHVVIPSAGHMGPVTHADVVGTKIIAFLEQQAGVHQANSQLKKAA